MKPQAYRTAWGFAMSSPRPLALSDVAIAQVMSACRPLSNTDRSRFIELLAARLNGKRELGDGEVYRLVRELQREVFAYPVKIDVPPDHFRERKLERQR